MIFREYDIRGIYGKDLTPQVVEDIGRSYSIYLQERLKKKGCTISLARDVRLSSKDLRDALTRGLTSAGLNVIDLGVCPTPLLYFSLFYLKKDEHPLLMSLHRPVTREVDGGIMITGSHNPPEYNGFKLCVEKETIYGRAIQDLKDIFEDLRSGMRSIESEIGKVERFDIITPYKEFMTNQLMVGSNLGRRVKVVVDAGNGTVGPIAASLLRQMSCKVIELYCEPDGRFPNHHPDPTIPENLEDLIEKVRETGADIGISYDGDGDRIGIIDSQGEIIWADRLMILFSRDILKRFYSQRPSQVTSPTGGDISASLLKPAILFDVKCSHLLDDVIERNGGRPLMWKTGHSLIKAKMKEEKALIAGEMSGHIFFADKYFGYDDAIYASLRLVEILMGEGKGVRELLSDLPETYATPEIRVDCPDEEKFKVIEMITDYFKDIDPSQLPEGLRIRDIITIDGVRLVFQDGWALVRASNTQPVLVLRFEAEERGRLEEIKKYIYSVLNGIRKRQSPPE